MRTLYPSKKTALWLSVAVLLIAALAILSHADELGLWFDELWSVFHSSTHVSQILTERDVTWPFGYFLTLNLWARVASWNDFSLHVLGAFFGILTTAFMINLGRRLYSSVAGLLAGLAFATSSYAIYFSLEIRGYGLMFLLQTAFVDFYLRWLKRPNLRRSLLLLATQIAMLYVHFILAIVIALAALHLLITAPRRFLRWLPIAALTALAIIPLIPQILRGSELRAALGDTQLPGYFLGDAGMMIRAFSAHWDIVFIVILILTVIGLLRVYRQIGWRTLLWFALWGLAIPVFAYLTRERSAIYTTRYLSFTITPIFLLIGIGLASLPRKPIGPLLGTLALLILAVAPWQPYDHRPQPSDDGAPAQQFVRAMADEFQPGDVLFVDPKFKSFSGYEAEYYEGLYFQGGHIPRVTDASTASRRVWYLTRQGSETKSVVANLSKGRIRTDHFWGPWYFIATLYEGPPSADGNLFGDGLRFHGLDTNRRSALHAGDKLDMTLWWSVDKPLPPELSMSIQLLDPQGKVVAQLDGMPTTSGTPAQLDAWQPNTLYLDQRQLTVPYGLHEGDYSLQLVVYRWQDGTRVPPANDATADKTLIIDKMPLLSFAEW